MLRMLRIYLVGFMGCGKTKAGEALAATLGVPFVDLDRLISQSFGSTVSQVFSQHGEPAFRAEEARLLKTTLQRRRVIVSTGGGTFCHRSNRAAIHESGGISVFLDVPWEVIVSRLPGKNLDRPKFESEAAARRLFSERVADYRAARIHLQLGGDEPPDEVARRVVAALPGIPCGT
jgi:shikimate kinase